MKREISPDAFKALKDLDYLNMNDLDYIFIAKSIIEMCPKIIDKYASLDDALKSLDHIIAMEQD